MKQQELVSPCWWECKVVQPLWKTAWQCLAELNILLPYDPAAMLCGIYPNELKTSIHPNTCTQIFMVPLVTTANRWKQSRCPLIFNNKSINQSINRGGFIQGVASLTHKVHTSPAFAVLSRGRTELYLHQLCTTIRSLHTLANHTSDPTLK